MLVGLLGSDWGLGGGSLEVLASARSALDAGGGGRRALLAGDAELLLGRDLGLGGFDVDLAARAVRERRDVRLGLGGGLLALLVASSGRSLLDLDGGLSLALAQKVASKLTYGAHVAELLRELVDSEDLSGRLGVTVGGGGEGRKGALARSAIDMGRGDGGGAVAPVGASVSLRGGAHVGSVELGARGHDLAGDAAESGRAGRLGNTDVEDRVGDGVHQSERDEVVLSVALVGATLPGRDTGRVNGTVDAHAADRGGRGRARDGGEGLANTELSADVTSSAVLVGLGLVHARHGVSPRVEKEAQG